MDSSIRDEGLPAGVDGDLVVEVQRRAAELQQVTAAAIEVSGAAPLLSRPAAAHVFRVAQEAMLNAVRHAEARHIEVRFGREDDRLLLVVRDDGRGLPAKRRPGVAGIRSMHNRATSLGGALSISTRDAERGTVVALEVPLR
jgi:signal transduction histidine kinase